MRARYDEAGTRHGLSSPMMKSGDLETVMKEVFRSLNSFNVQHRLLTIFELMDYLRTPPSPLAPPSKYTPNTIRELFTALRPYHLTKAELLMILNLRPQNVGVLDTIIEEMDDRFKNGEEQDILRLVGDVLGRDEVNGEEHATSNGGPREGAAVP